MAASSLVYSMTRPPPSILTAWTRASCRKRPALRIVSSADAWYAMNGKSPTTRAFGAPRTTAPAWRIMSSIVTLSVSG